MGHTDLKTSDGWRHTPAPDTNRSAVDWLPRIVDAGLLTAPAAHCQR